MARRQLSLFLTGDSAERIEDVRRIVDPVQSSLVPAHVTLCREDEIAALDLDEIGVRLSGCKSFTLKFDSPEIFGGHGILLGCVDGRVEFDLLRRRVLGLDQVREARAHITLAHSRNPRAPGNSLEAIQLKLPMVVSFDSVALIEQAATTTRWQILRLFPLIASKKELTQSTDPIAATVRPVAGQPPRQP
jgi:2'-5' RNA ligase